MIKTIEELEEGGFILIMKPKDGEKSNNKFFISSSLPSLRDITHQIDHIFGSSLPNKAPYKMNPN